MDRKGVYIVSADAKDLFLANYSNECCGGYNIRRAGGKNGNEINSKRFINTLDYCKDLIKLPELYNREYRRSDFIFQKDGKDLCRRVINVTFNYSVKDYNRFFGNTYIKFGYTPEEVTVRDGVCIIDGELAAVALGEKIERPVSDELLQPYFKFEDGEYKLSGAVFKVLYSVAKLREELYQKGFRCDGIQFTRFKRSSGSSRVGKCLFIDQRLYKRIHKWEMCGLKVAEGQEVDLAALEAYIALTLSSIIGLLTIKPENFLVIDDYDSVFKDKVIAVRDGEDGWLESKEDEVEIKNCIWDGQSLIDKSLLGEYEKYGMVLLRNRFFKSACFNCNLQQFFADHGITEVSQLNGRTIATDIRDIKIVTTPSSIKYLKFGKLEQWLEMLEEESEFGVVKHEKPTHFFDGQMVQIHYQLLNTLQMTQEEVDRLLKPSLDYLRLIQNDPDVLRFHIKHGGLKGNLTAAQSTNDVVYQMLGVTDKFARTKLCYDFTTDICRSYRKNLRKGHVLVDGNYSTLCGNPIEMLYATIGQFDGVSKIGVGNIHSRRFEYDKMILGIRSPSVTMGNIWLSTNRDNAEIEAYMNLTNEVVCINSIGENVLMRLSGAD